MTAGSSARLRYRVYFVGPVCNAPACFRHATDVYKLKICAGWHALQPMLAVRAMLCSSMLDSTPWHQSPKNAHGLVLVICVLSW